MSNHSSLLLIRADGSTHTGTGHVGRCLALAQAWQDRGGSATFALAQHTPALLSRLADEGFSTHTLEATPGSPDDVSQTVALAMLWGAVWIVADGYHFDAVFQAAIKAAGFSMLLVDDYGHADHYCADIVLNQNTHASEEPYSSRDPSTRLLLGTRYALLRREFWPWRGWQRETPSSARRVLVTLGGGDPDNLTLTVLHALREVDSPEPINVEVVVGGSNPHLETLQTAARELSYQVEVVQNVSDMPERMSRADIAISAGGSTNWELAFLGLPTLAIIVADNQRSIVEALHVQGIVHNLGWHAELTPATIAQTLTALLTNEARRAEMSQRGQALVDGDGAERIVMHLRGDPLRLRPAHESDCCLLWEWANDPEVRGASFNSDPIPWEEHVRWFAAKYHTPDTTIYIALDASDTPIGQVRFDRTGQNEAVVSISIDHYQRGKGYGKALLNLSAERLFSTWTISRIHSYIKQGNTASVRAFEQAGYQHVEPTEVQRYPAYHLMLYNHNRALKA